MTVKTRGIRLKDHLPVDDQGQRKLIQVTYSQLAALDRTRTATSAPQPQPATPSPHSTAQDRRRTLARMLRVELESTLTLLDRALEQIHTRNPTG
jgi:hypothetical protein